MDESLNHKFSLSTTSLTRAAIKREFLEFGCGNIIHTSASGFEFPLLIAWNPRHSIDPLLEIGAH